MSQNYTTQMDAARKGIITEQMKIVAEKEYMPVEQLRQLVEIYLDNAGKYAAGGTVTVALHRCGHASCRLSVENEGEPLSSEQLRDVFKRFYRADSARTRTGSFGLGLSIAQAVAAVHHGRVWAESRDGHNLFFAELPTAGNHEKQQERRKSGI